MPPPVEPAQAPMNINVTKMALEKVGHWLKSTVAKPVVVMMEETWKNAWRRLSPKDSYRWAMLMVMAPTAAATIRM